MAQVATGEFAVKHYNSAELPLGWAVTSSGRLWWPPIPANYLALPLPVIGPDGAGQCADQCQPAVQGPVRAVYVGDLGADTAASARAVLADADANNAVLLAVSPDQRAIEVTYGADLRGRGIESAAPLGVSAAASAFREGNLIDGLISALRVMSAGIAPAPAPVAGRAFSDCSTPARPSSTSRRSGGGTQAAEEPVRGGQPSVPISHDGYSPTTTV